jgi:hypothetical protein
MLDVHAPHEAIHTRSGFVLHITTITIGLLIAIGLEQTVEYFHHRSMVRETRQALEEEKQENIRLFLQVYQPIFNALARAADYFTRTADASTLLPTEVNLEIDQLKGIQAMEAVYGDILSWVGRLPDFGPVPDYWQMLPFYHMHEYNEWVAAHPEVAVQSNADLDAAKAHAGLPADTPDLRSSLVH